MLEYGIQTLLPLFVKTLSGDTGELRVNMSDVKAKIQGKECILPDQ